MRAMSEMRHTRSLPLVLLVLLACACTAPGDRSGGPQYEIDGRSLATFLTDKPGLETTTAPRFSLHYFAGLQPEDVERLAEMTERLMDEVEQALGYRYATRVEIYLPRPGAFQEEELPVRGLNGISATFGPEIFALIRSPYSDVILRHELVHCLYRGLERDPNWIEEGLAEYVGSGEPFGARGSLWAILERDGPVTLADLAGDFHEPDSGLRKRSTAWFAVLVLKNRYGLSLREIGERDDFAPITDVAEELDWFQARVEALRAAGLSSDVRGDV